MYQTWEICNMMSYYTSIEYQNCSNPHQSFRTGSCWLMKKGSIGHAGRLTEVSGLPIVESSLSFVVKAKAKIRAFLVSSKKKTLLFRFLLFFLFLGGLLNIFIYITRKKQT